VFEKETVNAVGGQLYVGNSTTITGSNDVSATDTVIQVANASGFAANEVIIAKKVTPTSVGAEYMKVTGVAFADASSDTNFSGSLTVTRGYSGSAEPQGRFVGDSGSAALTFTPGQVLVSTGKIGTGFIRLNANPTDTTTPYMDIVERTGSAIYDVDLKARLGDLSGLSTAQVGASPGFGLFTERAFLTNDVTVGTLGSEHITVDATSVRFIDNSTTMAELRGTTWTIGGAHGATDDVIVLSPGGGVAIQDSATDKVTITSSGITLKENNVDTITIASGVVTIGSATDQVEINGTSGITIRENNVDTITLAGGVVDIGDTSNEHVEIDSNGMKVKDGSTVRATFAATSVIGSSTDKVTISDSGLTLRENNVDTLTIASGVVTVGSSTDKVTINGTSGITIKENNVDTITLVDGTITLKTGTSSHEKLVMSNASIAMFSANSKLVDITDGKINIGPIANASATNGAVIGNIHLASGGAFIYGATVNDYVNVKSDGVDVYAAGTEVAAFGATTTIGNTSADHVSIDSDSIDIKDNNTVHATFGANSTITGGTITIQGNTGAAGHERLVLSSANLSMYTNNTRRMHIDDSGFAIGRNGTTDISTSTTDDVIRIADGTITIFQDNTHKATVTSAGLSVFEGSATVPEAIFGSTTTIGQVANSSTRVQIESDNVKIINRDGSAADTTMIEFNSSGTISAEDYIIEKTRLFGFGGDGTVTLTASDCTIANGGNGVGTKVNSAQIKDANGTVVCDRTSSTWIMKGDWYTYDLTLTGSTRLVTNGFRLFVFGTLTIGGSAIISHNGSGATGSGNETTPGEGAGEGTLKGGSDGGAGGEKGAAGGGDSSSGGDGGGAGGNGGIVFISARIISNSGNITATGGNGGDGEPGGTE
jgi:hypothetical protein